MPINPITASLVLYFELDYIELLELNEKCPQFLWKPLTSFGYSTLHLMPDTCVDPFEEFCSWPLESRDLPYFKMTQRRKAASVKIIDNYDEFALEKGVINVIKFKNSHEFIENADKLVNKPDCCFTVLFTVMQVPQDCAIVDGIKSLLNFQQSLKLLPSALINCPKPDWTRFSVSFCKGSEGEFRIRSDGYDCGIFDVSKWRGFAGGITQLYSLKAELSYIIGITGKYGD